MLNPEIENYLNLLICQPLHSISRIENTAFIGFGNDYQAPQSFEDHRLAENGISLQIQCAWRMFDRKRNAILFGSSDIHNPNIAAIGRICTFDWIKPDEITPFDKKAKDWIDSNPDVFAETFRFMGCRDLLLHLSNRHILHIYADSSTRRECWRLTEHGSDRDEFVVYGDGVYVGKYE